MNLMLGVKFIVGFAFAALPVWANEVPEHWQYDSIAKPTPGPSDPALESVRALVLGLVTTWNAHDLEGYMALFWHSPGLLVISEAEQYQGWDELYRSYQNGYADRHTMGWMEMPRVQVKLLRPDQAFVLTWWNVYLGLARHRVVGTTTMVVQHFKSDGWRIIAGHSNFIEP